MHRPLEEAGAVDGLNTNKVVYKKIIIRPSRFKYVLLSVLIALLGAGAVLLFQWTFRSALNTSPPIYLNALIFGVVTGFGIVYLKRGLVNRGFRAAALSGAAGRHTYIVLGDDKPVDEDLIGKYEDYLKRVDKSSEDYLTILAVLSFMYLQNALVYKRKDLYLKAYEYLAKARDAMKGVEAGAEVNALIEKLEKEVAVAGKSSTGRSRTSPKLIWGLMNPA